MASRFDPPNRAYEVLQEVTRLTLRLLDSKEPFLISNRAAAVLFEQFAERLRQRLKSRRTQPTLAVWTRRLPDFQVQLLNRARDETVTLRDGTKHLVITEERARSAVHECPDDPDF